MKYRCQDCGHEWDSYRSILYRQCPQEDCRSVNVLPVNFPLWVEIAQQKEIRDDTPWLDLFKAYSAIAETESPFSLGILEGIRIVKRIVHEVESRRISHGASVAR